MKQSEQQSDGLLELRTEVNPRGAEPGVNSDMIPEAIPWHESLSVHRQRVCPVTIVQSKNKLSKQMANLNSFPS
ncbi:MAG: hypothetical protein J0M35_08110 [Candidatus Obscuribacter phosphatis]|uniref:Uncharacterized protein n=1 Tax=Candidatus Obscuribacter phosphatis TaxID=1906157 RepID=A0A8J7PED6_9BACT|nr:hypothetical protein [Candidatus Obscuribacter phosphatis]